MAVQWQSCHILLMGDFFHLEKIKTNINTGHFLHIILQAEIGNAMIRGSTDIKELEALTLLEDMNRTIVCFPFDPCHKIVFECNLWKQQHADRINSLHIRVQLKCQQKPEIHCL